MADNSGEMPRPRNPTARRPPCPRGHQGDIWLDGFYGHDPHHERPRFRCVPRIDPHTGKRLPLHADGTPEHKFIEPLARRHPVGHAGASHFCEECEHVLDRHEGPQATRDQVFTIPGVARSAPAALSTTTGHPRSTTPLAKWRHGWHIGVHRTSRRSGCIRHGA